MAIEKQITIVDDSLDPIQLLHSIIDGLLLRLQGKERDRLMVMPNTILGKLVIDLIKREGLVIFHSPFLIQVDVSITDKGRDVIAAGGIQKYLSFWGRSVNFLD